LTPVITPAESIERLARVRPRLAEAVSLAIRIEPQLLRKMRLSLFPAADAGVEADVWFSQVVESRAPSGIVLQQTAAEVLRQRLGEKARGTGSSLGVIESLHRNISPAIFAEERLAYLALAGKHIEMRELLRSVVATLLSPPRAGASPAGWHGRSGRLPAEARYSEEAQMLASVRACGSARAGWWKGARPLERVAEWAAWLSPDDVETVPFGVALLEDAVEFGPVGVRGRTASNSLRRRHCSWNWGWHHGGYERTERVALKPQSLTIVEIGPGVTQVDIRTVLGDSYMLTVPEPRERVSLRKKLGRVRPPRAHITYDVQTGGAIEKRELPFVVGVLADLSGNTEMPLPPLPDRKFVQIDRDTSTSLWKR